jgi:pentatricopeptide repeat protein
MSAMTAQGLPPGPRAYHVLLCAYLKAKDLDGALQVTGRATEAGGVEWQHPLAASSTGLSGDAYSRFCQQANSTSISSAACQEGQPGMNSKHAVYCTCFDHNQ